MTDYKHFPRIPRTEPEFHINLPLFMLVLVLILGAMSFAGREDMAAAVVVDKQQLLEQTKEAVSADERAALYFYQQQAQAGK